MSAGCGTCKEVRVAKGICRTNADANGIEYARVDYGTGPRLAKVRRSLYERHEYKPPYDELPSCEESEA